MPPEAKPRKPKTPAHVRFYKISLYLDRAAWTPEKLAALAKARGFSSINMFVASLLDRASSTAPAPSA